MTFKFALRLLEVSWKWFEEGRSLEVGLGGEGRCDKFSRKTGRAIARNATATILYSSSMPERVIFSWISDRDNSVFFITAKDCTIG